MVDVLGLSTPPLDVQELATNSAALNLLAQIL